MINNSEQEQWKAIDGYPNYMVSSYGRIWSRNRNRCLKPRVKDNGYIIFALYSNGARTDEMIHRLVAQSFLKNPENLPQVNHLDGNKANNDITNLEWTTRQGNMRHAYHNGLIVGKKALDEARIEELRELYATGEWTQEKLAEKYNISQKTVSKYVREVPNSRHRKKPEKLMPETKKEIARLYATGKYSQEELGAMFGVSKTTVSCYLVSMKDSQ